jgi:Flp pilus assembly protein CpaB
VRIRLFKTRKGALIVSAVTALLAALLLVLYLRSYRSSVNQSANVERVLVATRLIATGTPAATMAAKNYYQVTTVQKSQLQPLAISDPSTIAGLIAATQIVPGQQLTQSDFTSVSVAGLNYQLTGGQRAIAVPLDTLHGLLGLISPGEFVDVYVNISGAPNPVAKAGATEASVPLTTQQVRLLAADIMVLAVPSGTSTLTILRVGTGQAAQFAYAADFEKFWFVLRPQSGAARTPPTVATLGSLIPGGG